MSPLALTLFILCMVANAIVFSMLGQGGGVLYTPIQVFFGIDFHTAATTSLFLIMVTSLSSTLVFRKAGKVDWSMALALESSTMLGAFCGGLFSGQFSGQSLSVLFAFVIAFAAVFMVREFKMNHECAPGRNSLLSWKRERGDSRYCINLALALPISFIAGALSGLIGVAGGILKIPMMVLLFGVPMDIAVASSAFMVGLTASGGFLGHLSAGQWDWRTSLILAVGVFIGGQVGARFALGIDKKKMKKGFGWFLFAMAGLMIAKVVL